MRWIQVKNFCRTFVEFGIRPRNVVLSQSLQVGSTANWLKTARLLFVFQIQPMAEQGINQIRGV